MENLDTLVLRTLHGWRQGGRHALLATVVRTWGSSPRPVGSIMALCEDGSVVGSVSGGCIEDDLIQRYAHGAPPGARAPEFLSYGVSADEAHRFGLPCGGTLQLLLEYDPCASTLAQLLTLLDGGALVRRTVQLADGQASLSVSAQPDALCVSDQALANTFGPPYRMLLIGAGQLTEYLATMALFNGFSVTVCDPREEYRNGWSIAGVTVSAGMPDDVVRSMRPDTRSCVVALTHDPKLDDLALLEALDTSAFYVGAIGSRRNNALRRERLIKHFGLTPQRLARLRGPIGLYIGSKTPAEIAVSVMAEILAVKNQVALTPAAHVGEAKQQLELNPSEVSLQACGVGPDTATG